MRVAYVAALVTLLATPLSAQDFERPTDWRIRFDDAAATEDELEMFVAMPPGWHVTSGPAAIYWDPSAETSGDFRLEMEVYLFDPGSRREAFGIFFGGRDLEGAGQAYTYFLLRNGGEYIVKRRIGSEAPTLAPWTAHEAIRAYADRGEDATVLNVLAVEARGSTVRFLVNDSEVWRCDREALDTDGVYGFRVNHGLNLHVSRLEAKPLA